MIIELTVIAVLMSTNYMRNSLFSAYFISLWNFKIVVVGDHVNIRSKNLRLAYLYKHDLPGVIGNTYTSIPVINRRISNLALPYRSRCHVIM